MLWFSPLGTKLFVSMRLQTGPDGLIPEPHDTHNKTTDPNWILGLGRAGVTWATADVDGESRSDGCWGAERVKDLG